MTSAITNESITILILICLFLFFGFYIGYIYGLSKAKAKYKKSFNDSGNYQGLNDHEKTYFFIRETACIYYPHLKRIDFLTSIAKIDFTYCNNNPHHQYYKIRDLKIFIFWLIDVCEHLEGKSVTWPESYENS